MYDCTNVVLLASKSHIPKTHFCTAYALFELIPEIGTMWVQSNGAQLGYDTSDWIKMPMS